MQTFRPFRSTIHRQQKYYSQKKSARKQYNSIFQMPRQVIKNSSNEFINPEQQHAIVKCKKSQNKFITDYQTNLKRSLYNESKQSLNQRTLQKVTQSYLINYQSGLSKDKLKKNKSQIYTNKNMAYQTLNILYRTIIDTKLNNKQKQSLQLNARSLPIIQKQVFIGINKKANNSLSKLKQLKDYQILINQQMNQLPITQIRTNQHDRISKFKGYIKNKNQIKTKSFCEILPWGTNRNQLEYQSFY